MPRHGQKRRAADVVSFNDAGQPRVAAPRVDLDDDPFPATEAGDAEFFACVAAGKRCFDHQRRRWFTYGRHHWRPDDTGQIVQAAVDAMRQRQAFALRIGDSTERTRQLKWTLAGECEGRIRHMLDIAATHPTLAVDGTQWDANAWVIGARNGVVDLATATLRPGRPEDYVTRVAAVDYHPDAMCPTWDRFIQEIVDNDDAVAEYLQRSFGYGVTGVTTEQVFWILFGHGANGKSTLLETITQHVIPEHSWSMSFPVSSWTESIAEYQRAELVGRRLIVAKEAEQAKRLNSEFIKSLTGGDTVNARHPYGRPFAFVPQCKLIPVFTVLNAVV